MNENTLHDRHGFHQAIAALYQERHGEAMALLQGQPEGWQTDFLDLRRQVMQKAAEAMPALFVQYPHLLQPEDWNPRPAGSYRDRDFRAILLNSDPQFGFFTVALVFDPGQSTSPHTHKTLCFGIPYKGKTEETLFDAFTFAAMKTVVRMDPHEIEIASPEDDGDLHAVGNPVMLADASCPESGMAVQIHLYDGYDLKAMLERGEIRPMVTGTPGEKLSGAAKSFEIAGYPSPVTGMRIEKPQAVRFAPESDILPEIPSALFQLMAL